MKRFSCFNLRFWGYSIASIDLLMAMGTLIICSSYLYNDFLQIAYWPQEEVTVSSPLANFFTAMTNYVLVHNFSNAFYMVLNITIWFKAVFNLAVAAILINGIKKQRPFCIAPWLINTTASLIVEITIFIFMEIKIDEIDTSVDRRIVRCILFGVFIVMSILFIFGIFALYNIAKKTSNETRQLEESIVETSGMFQNIKV